MQYGVIFSSITSLVEGRFSPACRASSVDFTVNATQILEILLLVNFVILHE